MKLPFTDTFAYIHNWQAWINKEENVLYTFGGIAVLVIQSLFSSLILVSSICRKYLNKTIDQDILYDGLNIILILTLLYIYVAFIFKGRYKKFVYNHIYIGKRGRAKAILIFIAAFIYLIIGFMSPCYIK